MPPNKALKGSGYFFGRSTVLLLERFSAIGAGSGWTATPLTLS